MVPDKILIPLSSLVAGILLLSMSGCSLDGPALEQEFTESTQITFTVKGTVEHRFDPMLWQTVYSPTKNEFVVCNDAMSDFYILRCSGTPREEGETVRCDVTWTTYSDVKKKKGLEFKVVKTDGASGTVWLWCPSAMMGAAVVADRMI